MGRNLLFLALVWRHLRRHALRSALTLLGVALGVAVAVAVQLANATALAAFSGAVRSLAGEARLQLTNPGGDLDERLVARLRPLADLATFSPALEGTAVVAGRPQVAFRLLGVDLLAPGAFRDYGQAPVSEALEGLWLTATAARRLDVRPGSRLELWINDQVRRVTVSGVLPDRAGTRTLDPYVAFLDMAPAQELLGRLGRLDRLDVLPRPGTELAALRQALLPLLPAGVEVQEPEQSNRQARKMLGAFRNNLLALSFVALIVGAYLIYNAVAVSVVQRRREVAILRAVGARRRQIFWLFAAEAGALGLLGALLGLGLGALLARGAVRLVARTVNAIYMDSPVQGVAWTPAAFFTGLGAGVGLALLAALLPALEAARTPAAAAMRPGSWEGRQRQMAPWIVALGVAMLGGAALAARGAPVAGVPAWGYLASVLIVVGCSLLAPLLVPLLAAAARPAAGRWLPLALAAGNFRGAAGRNTVAVASLMVGVAMMIGVATMVSSFRGTVSHWIHTVLPADLYLRPAAARGARPDATMSPALLPPLRALPGVAAVEGFRGRQLAYGDALIRLAGADMDVLARHGALALRDPAPLPEVLGSLVGADRVIVSETFVIKQGHERGDTITLPTPLGPRRFFIAAVYYDYSSDQGYVLMDRRTYVRYWQDETLTSIAVFAAPGVDTEALRERVQAVLGGRPVEIAANGEMRQEVLRVFDNTFAITYALHVIAITVSLLGVIGTLFALVLERQREISLLRYLGLTRGQVRSMIVAEAGLIGIGGAALGLAAGGLLSWLLINVINRQSFGWTIQWHLPYAFVTAALALVVLAALAAGAFPAAVAARTPIAEGLRYE